MPVLETNSYPKCANLEQCSGSKFEGMSNDAISGRKLIGYKTLDIANQRMAIYNALLPPANEFWGNVIFSQVFVWWGGLCPGGVSIGRPPRLNQKKRAVHIPLECFFVKI